MQFPKDESILAQAESLIQQQEMAKEEENKISQIKVYPRWTKTEDQVLLKLYEKEKNMSSPPISWKFISQRLNEIFHQGREVRNRLKTRQRFYNKLNPDIKWSRWSAEEDALIVQSRKEKMRWTDVKILLPGRNDHQIKNRYVHLVKQFMKGDTYSKELFIKNYKAVNFQTFIQQEMNDSNIRLSQIYEKWKRKQESQSSQNEQKTQLDLSVNNFQLNTAKQQEQQISSQEQTTESKAQSNSQTVQQQSENSMQNQMKKDFSSKEIEQNALSSIDQNMQNFVQFLSGQFMCCKGCGNQIPQQKFTELLLQYQQLQTTSQVQQQFSFQPQTQFQGQTSYEIQVPTHQFKASHQNQQFQQQEDYLSKNQKEQTLFYGNLQQQNVFQPQNKTFNFTQVPKMQQIPFQPHSQQQQQQFSSQSTQVHQNLTQGVNQGSYFYPNKQNIPGQHNFFA